MTTADIRQTIKERLTGSPRPCASEPAVLLACLAARQACEAVRIDCQREIDAGRATVNVAATEHRGRTAALTIEIDGDDCPPVVLRGDCWVAPKADHLSISVHDFEVALADGTVRQFPPTESIYLWACDLVRDSVQEPEIVAALTDHEPWRRENEERRREAVERGIR